MAALWIVLGILAAIILLLVILLHISVRAYVDADKKHLNLEVRYLGIRLYKLSLPDKSEKKPENQDKSSEPEISVEEIKEVDSTDDKSVEQADETVAEDVKKPDNCSSDVSEISRENPDKQKDKPQGPSLVEQFNEYKKYIPAGKKAFRKLLKLIRFYDLRLDLTVGNDDPYKAGLNFGRINAIVYSLLGLLCCIFSVKIKSTDIRCDYENKTVDFSFGTTVYVRPSAVIALAAYVGVYYLKIRNSKKKLEKTAKENANNE